MDLALAVCIGRIAVHCGRRSAVREPNSEARVPRSAVIVVNEYLNSSDEHPFCFVPMHRQSADSLRSPKGSERLVRNEVKAISG